MMHLLAYFDSYSSLKCHPCYHDMEPHFLYKNIISVIFFLHTYTSLIDLQVNKPVSLKIYLLLII